jgi:caffeoyl-CoA O-methyltransferase
MAMTPERWEFLTEYAVEVFGDEGPHLSGLMDRAAETGLPRIAISADVGKLLQILVAMTPAKVTVELGTLAGYSAIWIARGLANGGKLYTIEATDAHADFAEGEIERAGFSDRIEVLRGTALDVLPGLGERLGTFSVHFAFIDAVKREYVDYFETLKPMIAHGGVIVADNVYATGQGWIDEGHGTDEFNRVVAADPDFDAVAIPMREGLLIARRH